MLKLFRKFFKKNTALLELAKEAYDKEEFEQAIKSATFVLRSTDRSLKRNAYKLIGLSNYQLNKLEASLHSFQKFDELKTDSESNYNLSIVLLKLGEEEKAISNFNQAIASFTVDVGNTSHSIPNMKLFFAERLIETKHYDLAFQNLKDVGDVFCLHKTLDETFLFQRGIPDFISYLKLLNLLKNKVDPKAFDILLKKLKYEIGKNAEFFITEIMKNGN